MPLVVPGLTGNSAEDSKTGDWMTKLMGKKIGEGSDESVSFAVALSGSIYFILLRVVFKPRF